MMVDSGRVPTAPGSRERSPSVSAASGFDPSRIPWHIGATDESYGTMVWASRVHILRGHLELIADWLPEEATPWLRHQVQFAIKTADGFLRDWSPLRDSGSDPEGENSRSEVECEASQSGGEAASPNPHPSGASHD